MTAEVHWLLANAPWKLILTVPAPLPVEVRPGDSIPVPSLIRQVTWPEPGTAAAAGAAPADRSGSASIGAAATAVIQERRMFIVSPDRLSADDGKMRAPWLFLLTDYGGAPHRALTSAEHPEVPLDTRVPKYMERLPSRP